MIHAEDTQTGKRYRPTKASVIERYRGRSWLTRAAAAWERKAVARLRLNAERLTGREVWMLAALKSGGVLLRKHTRKPGCKTTITEWTAVPRTYRLREVKR
jgi:hypothetical protein